MGKFYLNRLPKKQRIRMIAEFYDVIDCLKNRDEIRLFFRDLLSPDEIASLVRRIQVAILLLSGFTYEEISEVLKVGKNKISNVQDSLARHGQGYRAAIKRYKKKKKVQAKERERIEKAATTMSTQRGYLKAKYPTMFLISYLLDDLVDWIEGEDGKGVEIIQAAREKRSEIKEGKEQKTKARIQMKK